MYFSHASVDKQLMQSVYHQLIPINLMRRNQPADITCVTNNQRDYFLIFTVNSLSLTAKYKTNMHQQM